ncbi:MAG TPA: hypothetical protein VHZ24_20180 [Pirellulales bacterium]|nr:hypothetical protein [Pirellulales bacterium]
MQRIAIVLLLGAVAGTARADEPVTYTKDVAKILWARCAACHRPGEVGPFSLLTYDDAAKRAEFIAQVTAERRMPPWHAEPGYGEFLDDRRLNDDELATIAAWAEAGAPQGDPSDLPQPPSFREGWQLGTPDLVLRLPEPFDVPADGRDVFRCFVIPTGVHEDRTVAAVEFRPGNRRMVHHALFFLDNTGRARERDELDAGPGYVSFGGVGIMPTGALGGWAPGGTPRRLPEGMGRMLRKDSDLVMQVHYHPNGKPETDQSELGIYFTREPAKRIVAGIFVVNRDIHIPPGEKQHRVAAEFTTPVDIEAVGVSPHMHYLGREMRVTAHLPDGSEQAMIWVRDWDFNWQTQYLYKQPMKLPAGTRIVAEAVYDNSADNPRNPNDPPRWVSFGEQTTNEMCLCGIPFIARSRDDYMQVIGAMIRSSNPLLRWQQLFGKRTE